MFKKTNVQSDFVLQEYNVLKPRYSILLKGALQRDKVSFFLSINTARNKNSSQYRSVKLICFLLQLIEDIDLWAPLPVSGWQHCKQSSNLAFPRSSRGYIQVFLNGGLNQQRMGVSKILF